MLCQQFVILGGHSDFVDDYLGLHIVAADGVDLIVRRLTECEDDLTKKDAYGRAAHYIACGRGFHALALLALLIDCVLEGDALCVYRAYVHR